MLAQDWDDHKTPCKLVKFVHPEHPEFDANQEDCLTFMPKLAGAFCNCFMIEQDKVLLLTKRNIILFDSNLKQLH